MLETLQFATTTIDAPTAQPNTLTNSSATAARRWRVVKAFLGCMAAVFVSVFATPVSAAPSLPPPVPTLMVTVSSDSTTGVAGNCTDQSLSNSSPDLNCSLRDALAFVSSGASGPYNITFSPSVFTAGNPGTIVLNNGTLIVPPMVNITGLTSGSGASLTNLVTVDGSGAYTVFTTGLSGGSQWSGDAQSLRVKASATRPIPNGIGPSPMISDSSSTITLANLTIQNGAGGADGNGIPTGYTGSTGITGVTGPTNNGGAGGINNYGALALNNCTFSTNSGIDAGAIYNWDGNLTVTGSTFTGNSSGGGSTTKTDSQWYGDAGAIFNDDQNPNSSSTPTPGMATGSLSVTNSTFTGNTGSYSGGIYNYSTVTVTGSTFGGAAPGAGNVSTGDNFGDPDAGALVSNTDESTATATVTNSTFTNNSGAFGGAITNARTYADGVTATLQVGYSTFIGNSSSGIQSGIPFAYVMPDAGAIDSTGGSVTGVAYSTFYGNTSSLQSGTSLGAGALANSVGAELGIFACTITGNKGFNGAVFNLSNSSTSALDGGKTNLANSIVSGNSTSDPNAGTDGTAADQNGMKVNKGNVINDPNNADLAPLGNYGGPTQTMIPLAPSSAICAGSSKMLTAAENTYGNNGATLTQDQRGYPNTNASYASTVCLDAGAVQTNYWLQFGNSSYNGTVNSPFLPAPVVFAEESSSEPGGGNNMGGIPITLTYGYDGATYTPGSPFGAPVNTVTGIGAAFNGIDFTSIANGVFTATTVLNPAAPTSTPGSTISLQISTVEGVLVTAPTSATVTVSTSIPGLGFFAFPEAGTGSQYTNANFTPQTWQFGTAYELYASSQFSQDLNTYYLMTGWSDGTAGSTDLVIASASTPTQFTANFTTNYAFSIASSNTAYGTVSWSAPYSLTVTSEMNPLPGTYVFVGSTVTLTATPNPGYYFTGWTGANTADLNSTSNPNATLTMNGPENLTANFAPLPGYLVNTIPDDLTGSSANCPPNPAPGAGNCSLRDALAAAASTTGGTITFDSTVFATAQNIQLGGGGSLEIPSNTVINGLTSGSGYTLTNLVSVFGGIGTSLPQSSFNVFRVEPGVTGAAINNVTIGYGQADDGGGIKNQGVLSISNSTVSNNTSTEYSGGGIHNSGTLTITGSTIANNKSASAGGGIYNLGTLTMVESTLTKNTAVGIGGGICNGLDAYNSTGTPTATLTNVTTGGNTDNGTASNGIYNSASLTLVNGLIADALSGTAPSVQSGGNVIAGSSSAVNASSINLGNPGSNGGPTMTSLPQPQSIAICGGLVNSLVGAVDQRGLSNLNGSYPGYTPTAPCVDAGAVQTNYALAFNASSYSASSGGPVTPFWGFTVTESNQGFGGANVQVNYSGAGSLSDVTPLNSSFATAAGTGIFTDSQTTGVNAGSGDLNASLALNASLSPALNLTTTAPVTIAQPAALVGVSISVGGMPASGIPFTVDGTTYTTPQTFANWAIGSQHTLAVTTPTYTVGQPAGTEQMFVYWGGGSTSPVQTITVVPGLTTYIALYFPAYPVTYSASDPVNGSTSATYSPEFGGQTNLSSGSYVPADSSVYFTATTAPGYYVSNWMLNGVAQNQPSPNYQIGALSGAETVIAVISQIGNYVVTTAADDAGSDTGANCTPQATPATGTDASCSLRDAVDAANTAGAGNISFDSRAFAATNSKTQNTIFLKSTNLEGGLSLNVPMAITGPGAGILTVDGGSNSNLSTIFNINGLNGSVTAISGMTIADGLTLGSGGAISNQGSLTVSSVAFVNNKATYNPNSCGDDCDDVVRVHSPYAPVASYMVTGSSGGAIWNGPESILWVTGCTFSGNSALSGTAGVSDSGGAIFNSYGQDGESAAQMVVIDSTFIGNSADIGGAIDDESTEVNGGHIVNDTFVNNSNSAGQPISGAISSLDPGMLVYNSIFSGNTGAIGSYVGNIGVITIHPGSGAALSAARPMGINEAGAVNVSNSVFFNNIGSDNDEDDCVGCGTNSNSVSANPVLAPLSSYGGSTQTLLPLPGSSAICAGAVPSGITVAEYLSVVPYDQRGLPRFNSSYPGYATTACLDAGAVQTNYALAFIGAFAGSNTTAPGITAGTAFTAANAPAVTLTESGAMATAASGTVAGSGAPETASGTTSAVLTAGLGNFAGLSFPAVQANEMLTGALSLNARLSTPLSIDTTSAPFSVTSPNALLSLSPAAGALASGTVNTVYTQAFTASGGVSPYTYAETGTLPQGLSFSSTTGILSGTPGAAGNFSLSVTATDSTTGTAQSVTQNYTLTVNSATGTAVTLSVGTSLTPSVYGNTVTFTATITSGATGTVAFLDSGVQIGSGTISGVSATFSTSTLAVGSHSISASYAGSATYNAANSSAISQVVNQATPVVAVTASTATTFLQNAVTFTATVTSPFGNPSGTVTFEDGATPLGTGTVVNGVATLTSASLTAGSHSIVASYGGDTNFLLTPSSPFNEFVEDFTITAASVLGTGKPGSSVEFSFTVNPPSGTTFPAAIELSLSGLPTGITYSFSPAALLAGGGSTPVTLTVNLPQTTAKARPSDNLGRRLAPLSLALILLPFAGRLRRASRRLSRTMSLLLLLGFGLVASLGLGGCSSTVGFFGQKPQTYTVTVTGTSGALSHSATVTLNVE